MTFQNCSPKGFSSASLTSMSALTPTNQETTTNFDISTDAPYPKLSDSGILKKMDKASLINFKEFEPQYPLYSDHAAKRRFIYIPRGQQVDTSDPDNWTYPQGTIFWKEFSIDGKKIETRVWEKMTDGLGVSPPVWRPSVYVWRVDQSDADLLTVDDFYSLPPADRQMYQAAQIENKYKMVTMSSCVMCHGSGKDTVQGFNYFQLSNKQLKVNIFNLKSQNLLSNPPLIEDEIKGSQAQKDALGYMQTNCATCHNSENSFFASRNQALPNFKHKSNTLGYDDETINKTIVARLPPALPLITFGDLENSLVYQKMLNRSMPKINLFEADPAGLLIIKNWINENGPLPPLALNGVFSRKTAFVGNDKTYDIPIDITKEITSADMSIEPRIHNGELVVLFRFNRLVNSVGSATVVDSENKPAGTATIMNLNMRYNYKVSQNEVAVLLDVPNSLRVRVTISGVNGGTDSYSASLGYLAGDFDGSGLVDANDLSLLTNIPDTNLLTPEIFKFDIDSTGTINSDEQGDRDSTVMRLGTSLVSSLPAPQVGATCEPVLDMSACEDRAVTDTTPDLQIIAPQSVNSYESCRTYCLAQTVNEPDGNYCCHYISNSCHFTNRKFINVGKGGGGNTGAGICRKISADGTAQKADFGFSTDDVVFVTPSTNELTFNIRAIGTVGSIPAIVNIEEMTEAVCGATTSNSPAFTVNGTDCLPNVYNAIIARGLTDTQNFSFQLARGEKNMSNDRHRFDWDVAFATSSTTLVGVNPSRDINVRFSTDIRKETNNRLFRLKLSASGDLDLTKSAQTKYVVILKVNNPVPAPDEVTFSMLMNPNSGVLASNCLGCHNSQTFSGGYDMTNYAMMINNGIINPIDASSGVYPVSKMYVRTDYDNPLLVNSVLARMPLNGFLSVEARQLIHQWILSGAKNN